MNKKKQDCIDEWMGKDKEWLCNQLYRTIKKLDSSIQESKAYQNRYMEAESKYKIWSKIERHNRCLATVLESHGVNPVELIVYYFACPRFNETVCNYEEIDYYDLPCNYPDDVTDECLDKCNYSTRHIELMYFYTFEVNDDMLAGIRSDFEDIEICVEKIVLANSGTVLYELEKESDDE